MSGCGGGRKATCGIGLAADGRGHVELRVDPPGPVLAGPVAVLLSPGDARDMAVRLWEFAAVAERPAAKEAR